MDGTSAAGSGNTGAALPRTASDLAAARKAADASVSICPMQWGCTEERARQQKRATNEEARVAAGREPARAARLMPNWGK